MQKQWWKRGDGGEGISDSEESNGGRRTGKDKIQLVWRVRKREGYTAVNWGKGNWEQIGEAEAKMVIKWNANLRFVENKGSLEMNLWSEEKITKIYLHNTIFCCGY